eukprot:4190997-Pyramimonas_sp.AAC.1
MSAPSQANGELLNRLLRVFCESAPVANRARRMPGRTDVTAQRSNAGVTLRSNRGQSTGSPRLARVSTFGRVTPLGSLLRPALTSTLPPATLARMCVYSPPPYGRPPWQGCTCTAARGPGWSCAAACGAATPL